MRIREASVDDARAVAGVHINGWRAIYRGQMPDTVLDSLDIDRRSAQWHEWIGLRRNHTLVADAPPVVGFCNLVAPHDSNAIPQIGEITAIYLEPMHWRRGIGRQLTIAALSHAREHRYEIVTLWVLSQNTRARAFYEALGFATDGSERTDTPLIGTPLREVRYGISLGRPA